VNHFRSSHNASRKFPGGVFLLSPPALKTFLIVFIFLLQRCLFAAEVLYPTKLEVKYNYSSGTISWEAELKTSIEKQKLPEHLIWNLRDTKKKRFVADVWFETSRDKIGNGHFKIDQSYVLYRILPHQGDLEMVFSSKDNKELLVIPIGTLCKSPGKGASFVDVGGHAKKCFEILESDLPQDPSP
jgi:hypothetical protein